MNERTDHELLREYAREKSEPAFTEFVCRYVDLVYSVAWRTLANTEQARDVTQGVFVAVAQQAPALATRESLAGWLHTTARNLAAKQVRTEARRRAREKEAAMMQESNCGDTNADETWATVAPHLDSALEELPETDREALLLRYFHNHRLRSVGVRLGISDDAAQKRVTRAIDRLRVILERRGVRVGTAALMAAITSFGVQAAPAGLALSICATATMAGTVVAATTTLAMTALQKTIIGATIAVLAGAGVFEARQIARLEGSVEALTRAEFTMRGQVGDLEAALKSARQREAALFAENSRWRSSSNSAELLALRGEVSRLRSSASTTDDTAEVRDLLARVDRLKLRLQQNPTEAIPELQLATQKDWLAAADRTLESDTDYRKAMAALRSASKGRFASQAAAALKQFCADHEGRHPESLHEIQPYLGVQIDPSVFDRYEILPQSDVIDIGLGGEKIVGEKTAVDEEFDSRVYFASNGNNGASTFKNQSLNPLFAMARAFKREHGARDPASLEELLPYARTTEQRATIERLQTALSAYKRDNNGAGPDNFELLKPYLSLERPNR